MSFTIAHQNAITTPRLDRAFMKNTVLTILLGLLLTGPGTGKAGEATDSIAKPLENRANGSEGDLEPYLKKTLPDLVAQIESEDTPYIIKRRAMSRIVARYPKEAPDALMPFLFHPGAHLNEYTGQVLFQLGRPNSKTDELIVHINEGRRKWTKEQMNAFAQAISWPGNNAAIPVLQQMIDAKWDTRNEAKLCLARIQDTDGPCELLKLSQYGFRNNDYDTLEYWDRVGQLLRAAADIRANDTLLKAGDPSPALALWDRKGIYALAWPGNKALADAYLKTPKACGQFDVAAARTQDERCLKLIRSRFETAAASLVAAKSNRHDWYSLRSLLIAGVEAANAEDAQTLKKLLKRTEDMRIAAEAAALKARSERTRFSEVCSTYITDPVAFEREIILIGLCIHPNPEVRTIIEPCLNNNELGYYVGLALLRSRHEEGLQYLLNYWAWVQQDDAVADVFLLYTAANIPYDSYAIIGKAKAWYAQHRGSEQLRNRVRAVNQSGLSDELVEPLKLWP
jgi:hypothetical protein